MIVKGDCWWGAAGGGRGKKRVMTAEYDQSTLYICTKIT
jgi:hypothetical protein